MTTILPRVEMRPLDVRSFDDQAFKDGTPLPPRPRLAAVQDTSLEEEMEDILSQANIAKPADRSALPGYVEHHADVSEIGRLTSASVVAQYEESIKALEELGKTMVDYVKRSEDMAAECKAAITDISKTVQMYRDDAKGIFERIETAARLTADVRSLCADMQRRITTS